MSILANLPDKELLALRAALHVDVARVLAEPLVEAPDAALVSNRATRSAETVRAYDLEHLFFVASRRRRALCEQVLIEGSSAEVSALEALATKTSFETWIAKRLPQEELDELARRRR